MGTERTPTPTPSTTNRRRYPRAPLSLLVQFRFNSVQEFLSEYATNMSMGGMFIRTTDPREIGTLVYFQFTLKDGSKLIEGLGRVTWVSRYDPEDKSGQNFPGMGLEFVNIDEDSTSLIEQIVTQNLKKADEPK
ncbi:MAG: TIGR02266 family protein [Deltaproteobacteria bacterium]|nr:TIGR02266 family protein [Deltaproteobacteria bacterium]